MSVSEALYPGSPTSKPRLSISLTVRRSRLLIVVLALMYRVVIDLSYAFVVEPLFHYAGYELRPNLEYLYTSYILVAVMALLLPSREDHPSTDITFVFYVITYIPFTSLFALQPGDPEYFILLNLAFLILFATVKFVPTFRALPNISYRLQVLFALTLLCTAYVFATVVIRGGLSLVTFDITRVYSVRWDINNKILVGLSSYLVEWCSKIFIPALLVYGIWTKRRVVTLGSLALIIVFFGITSAKGVLAYPILVLIAYYGKKWDKFRTGFLWAAIAVPVLAFITYLSFGDVLVTGFLLNRIYFVPTLANFQYYDFFQTHPMVYWSNTFMSAFYAYPYNDPIPIIMGRATFEGGTDSFTNVGIFATGYMQFGVIGMLIFPLLAGLSLKVIDSLAVNRMPAYVALALSVVAGIQYLSGDLTETLLSHGVFMAWVTIYLMGDPESRGSPKTRPPHEATGLA